MIAGANIRQIAFLGDYLPRKCGIATFTSDLLTAVAAEYPQCQCFAVPVNDIEAGYDYPDVVRFEIEEQDLSSYQRAADFLNIGNADVVCLQHEFGIFGGPAGSHVLALLRELKMPVVTTLHSILRQPNPDQRRVMEQIVTHSARVVVMSIMVFSAAGINIAAAGLACDAAVVAARQSCRCSSSLRPRWK